MFEKFRSSKEEIENTPERKIKLGGNVLEKEADADIPAWRSGGYMLSTILAMGLSLGAIAGKSEAQVFNQGRGSGGQAINEILNRGTFEIGSSIDRAQNQQKDKIEHWYVDQLGKLEEGQQKLEFDHATKTISDNNYKIEKARLAQKRILLKREYDKRIRSVKMKREITGMIIGGVRGW